MVSYLLQKLDRLSRRVTENIPLGALVLFHGVLLVRFQWPLPRGLFVWLFAATLIAVAEFGVFNLIWAGLTWDKYLDILHVFERFPACKFREVPLESYFARSEHYARYNLLQDESRIVLKPYVVAACSTGPGHFLANPTAFDTGVSPVIFVPDLPAEEEAVNRFLLLHEIGHDSDKAGPDVKFYQILALLHILGLAVLLPLCCVWTWRILPFMLGVLSLYWYQGLRLLLEDYSQELTREVIADEHALQRLSPEDCERLKEPFKVGLSQTVAELIKEHLVKLKRPMLVGRYEDDNGVIRWQVRLDQLLRRLKGEKFEPSWIGVRPNQFPLYLGITFLLLYTASFTWRWDYPPLAALVILGSISLIALVAGFYVRIKPANRLHTLLADRAPRITSEELSQVEATRRLRRQMRASLEQ